MARDETERLRQEIKRARRNATRKLARLKNVHGVYGAGTKIDPRRDPGAENKMRSRDLRVYLNQLQRFTDRSTQYVSDAANRPMPKSEWRRFEKVETEYQRLVAERFRQFANIKIPSGETVLEELTRRIPDHRRIGNVDVPIKPRKTQPHNIASLSKLRKRIKDIERRTNPRYFDKLVETYRGNARQMIEVLNEPELMRRVEALSDRQFELIWNYRAFSDALSIPYGLYERRARGEPEERHHAKVISDSLTKAYEYVEWAENQ